MVLASNTNRRNAKVEGLQIDLVNATVVFGGSFAGLNTLSAATAANRGRAQAYNDQVGMFFLGGWFNRDATGDTSASPEVNSRTHIHGAIVQNVTVTGGAGDRTDVLQPVFLTDDDVITLTRPTFGAPVGFILKHLDSTSYDVVLLSAQEHWLITMSGSGQYTWFIGSFDITAASSGDLAVGIESPHHAQITRLYAIVDVATTGASGTITVNLEIGGTNITDGVITVVTSTAQGVKVANAVDPSALNVIHEGDLIDVEIVVGTTLTAGRINLYAEVQLLPGL